ncbi:hypothetical protein TNCV_201841 [Trichonephila clavipes]|nr:hypothetical protein TNCV_201841 [Trichonephila clavipes]
MSSSRVPLKTHRVEQRCTLNLSKAEASFRWCGVVVRRGGCQFREINDVTDGVLRHRGFPLLPPHKDTTLGFLSLLLSHPPRTIKRIFGVGQQLTAGIESDGLRNNEMALNLATIAKWSRLGLEK